MMAEVERKYDALMSAPPFKSTNIPMALAGVPGIYLFSENGHPLYIGRTDDIRRRLQSHRHKSHNTAILLLLLGVILPHFLRKETVKRERFVESSHKFLQAFEPELLVLRREGDITAYETLRNSFNKHYSATSEFKRGLKGKELNNFIVAWETYCTGSKITSLQQYQSTGNHEETKRRRLLALHHIETILKFADHKIKISEQDA